jgi:hypothetical protein
MAFAAFEPLAGVIPDVSAMAGGLDTLTVQNRGGGAAALGVGFSDENTQDIVEHGPLMVVNPLPEDMIYGLPMGKVGGQIAPRTAALDQIQDGVKDASPILGWAATFGRFGEHWFEVSPLGVGKIGVVSSDFHRPTGATANESRQNCQSNQAICSFISRSRSQKHSGFLFQTHSYWILLCPNRRAGHSMAVQDEPPQKAVITKFKTAPAVLWAVEHRVFSLATPGSLSVLAAPRPAGLKQYYAGGFTSFRAACTKASASAGVPMVMRKN